MDRDALLGWLAGEFIRRFGDAVAGMAGKTPSMRYTAGGEAALAADSLWWRQPFSSLDGAVFWVGAEPSAWMRVGTEALAGAGLEDASPEDCRGTYLELIQQAMSGVAGTLTARAGREVLPDGGKEAEPSAGEVVGQVEFRIEGAEEALRFVLVMSRGFADAMTPPAAAAPPPAAMPTMGAAGPDPSDRYELLLDVELPVSVSFGRAQLPLRDVVKLTSGAIVELNRAVSEPVELIVNNCVIARGEVVVVDGNYGVRIKQIISRRERLRTLH